MNLIAQQTVVDEILEARIVNLEVENNTSMSKNESLESWIPKHYNKIKQVYDEAQKSYKHFILKICCYPLSI